MSSRTTLLVATAVAALTVAGTAQAQDAPPADQPGIGQEVRDVAREQDRTDDQRGIGSEVREIASAQNDDTVDDDDGGDDTDGGTDAAESQGIGEEVREAAQDPAREGGIGAEVRDIARDRGEEPAPDGEDDTE